MGFCTGSQAEIHRFYFHCYPKGDFAPLPLLYAPLVKSAFNRSDTAVWGLWGRDVEHLSHLEMYDE
jgi:hypothetical protein